jgi:muramoyltetrapeptide carboxypeptidase
MPSVGFARKRRSRFDSPGVSRYLGAKLTPPSIRKPPRIRPGDVVGVIAPSGAVDADRLAAGVAVLEGWGFRVEVGRAVLARRAYLAGDDRARRADIEHVLADARIRAVFCARGGYGSQRLLPDLDLAPLARTPKLLIGYSDATALLNAVLRAGVVAVHGPMVADDVARGLSPRSTAHLRALLGDPDWRWEVEAPEIVRTGRARGRLVGGCLAVLVAALGTPWAPDTDGAVLFLEDVAERPYRLDRLLTQLRQSGKLDRVAGIVFGTMAACPPVDGIGPLDVVRECCGDLGCPIAFGVPAGHDPRGAGCENLALPLGVPVELDAERGRLVALEPAVS